MIAAPFFVEANEGLVIATVETEFERAFENQAAREGLNVSHRQPVMSSTAQLIERVYDVHYFAKFLRVH